MEQINEFLTYKEVQDYLKISESTLFRAIDDSANPLRVTYITEGSPRIKLTDLTEWINKQNEIFKKLLRCVSCGSIVKLEDFKDRLSKKEWTISQFCQSCITKTFDKGKDE